MKLSEKIVQLRKGMGLSQEQLAELCGVSRQAVSKWENDQALPDLDKLVLLSKTFSISTDELLGLTVKKEERAPVQQEEASEAAEQNSTLEDYLTANRRKRCLTLGWVTVLVGVVLLVMELLLCPVMQYIERMTFNSFRTYPLDYLDAFPLNIVFIMTVVLTVLGGVLFVYGMTGKKLYQP